MKYFPKFRLYIQNIQVIEQQLFDTDNLGLIFIRQLVVLQGRNVHAYVMVLYT